jgi:hypothetical protein
MGDARPICGLRYSNLSELDAIVMGRIYRIANWKAEFFIEWGLEKSFF